MGDVLISGPAEEPVSVAELRSYLRDPADADSVLTRLIKAAREYVEEATGLIMVSQVRELTLDAWPGGGDGLGWWDGVQEGALIGRAPRYVELPRGPLISITSVKTYDTGNNATTWEAGNYFADTGTTQQDFDAIFTGDLGEVGSTLLHELMHKAGCPVENHQDCGCLLYDVAAQNVQAGGSGAGCSAAVLAAHVLPGLVERRWRRVLFLSTGALMSQTTFLQKEGIPAVAHLVELRAPQKGDRT